MPSGALFRLSSAPQTNSARRKNWRMLAWAQLTLSLSLPVKPAVVGKQFHRATDLFSSEPSASAVDVVNVLGRWSTYAQAQPAQRREQLLAA